MNKYIKKSAIAAALCLVSLNVPGIGVVREFQGNSNMTTAEFEVQAPWILDWRVNGEYSQMLGFEIDLINARNGLHDGKILKTKRRGNGVKLFDKSGRYRLRITSSLAKWQIIVEEISREDAKLYTPRGT